MPKEIDGVTYFTKDEVYMDQSEVDRVIQDRLSRVERKPDDYDTLKEQVQTLNASEAELKASLESKDMELTAAIEAAKAEGRSELLPELNKAKVRNAAILKGFRNPDDAVAFYGEIPADVSDEGIGERLGEIATERAYLLSGDPAGHSASAAGIGVSGAGSAPVEPGLARVAAAFESN